MTCYHITIISSEKNLGYRTMRPYIFLLNKKLSNKESSLRNIRIIFVDLENHTDLIRKRDGWTLAAATETSTLTNRFSLINNTSIYLDGPAKII